MSCDNINEIKASLAEAKAAYHDLLTGAKVRAITDSNGERVEFMAANSSKLYSYIQSLEGQLAACSSGTGLPTKGPLGFIF